MYKHYTSYDIMDCFVLMHCNIHEIYLILVSIIIFFVSQSIMRLFYSEEKFIIGLSFCNLGFIRLANNNSVSKPIIQAKYFQDPQDVAVLIEGIQLAISLMNSSELAKFNLILMNPSIQVCSQFRYLSKKYWNCVVKQDTGPENHQAGSCKMGPVSDPMAVVDSTLKVHGINGLRVADTSIKPESMYLFINIDSYCYYYFIVLFIISIVIIMSI